MAHIVIVGASTGGLPMAYDLKKQLGKQHRVTVVSNVDQFTFVPSNPWVGVGWRTRKDISFDLAPHLARKNIEFIHQAMTDIKPQENQILLANNQTLDYDYLILATGPKLAFDEVEGLGPQANTLSVCTTDHAEQAYDKWQSFCQNPGPIVVGAVQGASCFGPAYEYAFIMDTDLRKQKIRKDVPITYITSEPYIGHLGIGGVGDSKGMLESEMRSRHIKWICNAKVTKITPDTVFADEYNENGEVIKHHEIAQKYTMLLPAFKGQDAVAHAGEDLVNPRGFVKVDAYNRNPKWHNIYAIGVGIAIPPVEPTPVPVGTPKTGLMIEGMVSAVCHNIQNAINGQEPSEQASWNTVCLADMGDTGAIFVALPQIPPRNTTWTRKGKWVHLAKIAFEKYFIRNMKAGNPEPIYQKWIMKKLGLTRLKSE